MAQVRARWHACLTISPGRMSVIDEIGINGANGLSWREAMLGAIVLLCVALLAVFAGSLAPPI